MNQNEAFWFSSTMKMEKQKNQVIHRVDWERGLTYPEYRDLINQLLEVNKTTGDNHSANMLEYTILNVKRMNKWDKIAKISPELEQMIISINNTQNWLILTEAWCGDAAQNIPFIAKLASLNRYIHLKLLLRDEHPDIMDAYLTDGGRSIPKLIIMDDQLNELNQWGPRPAPAQKKLKEMKAGRLTYEEYALDLHAWYGKDRGATLQQELAALLSGV